MKNYFSRIQNVFKTIFEKCGEKCDIDTSGDALWFDEIEQLVLVRKFEKNDFVVKVH